MLSLGKDTKNGNGEPEIDKRGRIELEDKLARQATFFQLPMHKPIVLYNRSFEEFNL